MKPRVFLSLTALAALAALTVSLAGLGGCSKKEPVAEPIRAVRVLTVGGSSLVTGQEYPGEVRARSESRLGFRVAGKLTARPVNLGDTVRAGQVLAQLDPMDYQLAQDSAQSAVAAAKVNLEQSLADQRRAKDLRDQGFVGAAELERRDNAVRAARSQLEQAQAQASVQVHQASYTTLKADTSGVVTAVEAEPGQVLAAGSPVVRLALDGPRDVVFTVPEDRVSALRALLGKAGALSFQVWGSGDWMPTTVREVSAAADPVTRTFLVKADLGRATVRLGQTVSVRAAAPAADKVIKLPMAAVVESQGHSAVWLLDTGTMTVRTQAVALAGADGNAVVIAQGLKAGDQVVVAGTHALSPGQAVKLYLEPRQAAVAASPAAPASH